MSDSLRRELSATGVRVVVVEPGDVVTPIWTKGQEAVVSYETRSTADVRARYDHIVAAARARAATAQRSGMSADKVAEVVLEALSAADPRTRYQVGREAKLLFRLRRVLPDRAMDAIVRRALK